MKSLPPDVSTAIDVGQATREPKISLRDYQQAGVNAVLKKWNEFNRLLGVGPTGCGKTHIFTAITEERRSAGPVLILAHREQASEKQKRYCRFLRHPDPWQLTKRQANCGIAQHKFNQELTK